MRVALKDVRFFERPVVLRLPFKFGAVTLTHAPHVFVRAEVEVDGRMVRGVSAELLAPKWFDKNPALTNEQNFDQLRTSLRIAAGHYLAATEPATAFALHEGLAPSHYCACAEAGLNGLIASYGLALIDRAILDALCRGAGVSALAALQANLPGITAGPAPDLYAEDLDGFLASRRRTGTIAVRHTVGMADAIAETEVVERLGDGLPESLEGAVATYGHRHFKLKVGGDVAADVDRLTAIAGVLDRIDEPYMVSLDGNEQYADAAAVLALVEAVRAEPRLARLWSSTSYLEQPIARDRAADEPVHAIAAHVPVAADESDAHLGVFPVFRALGYRGMSSKSCKGFYRALLNAARVAAWNRADGAFFMIAEDLTTQPGVSMQQDLVQAALVGATHVERNGHHFVDGFADAPASEAQRYLAAHPDLYVEANGRVRLRIANGSVSLASLDVPGLANATEPDWSSLAEMPG